MDKPIDVYRNQIELVQIQGEWVEQLIVRVAKLQLFDQQF